MPSTVERSKCVTGDAGCPRYGFKPVLLETFVECERHRGTSYKAANWVHVGKTVGRGKKSRVHAQIIPIKDIWLYPLRQNFRAALCA